MITRDPLNIPCFEKKYWATLAGLPAQDLASTLSSVRKNARKEPIARVTKLTPEQQLEAEVQNVKDSFAYAAKTNLLPAG